MSKIFDALQRSEAEQQGARSPQTANANELLQQTERRTASQWEAASSAQQAQRTELLDVENSSRQPDESPDLTTPRNAKQAAIPLGDSLSRSFPEFPSLHVSPTPRDRLVCLTDPETPAAEAFRLVGTRLREIRQQRPLKRVLITSTVPQEGKSLVSANLALTLAVRQKTLLLEGDVRRPTLSQILGLPTNPGLCEWLREGRPLQESIYRLDQTNLWLLPAGSAVSIAQDILQPDKLSALLNQLHAWFDWIVIDSPPILPLADTSIWTGLAQGILMVTRQGFTEKRQLKRGVAALDPDKLLGALLNSRTRLPRSDYYYYRPPAPPQGERNAKSPAD